MDKKELERLRVLAGNTPAVKKETTDTNKTVQTIMETYVPVVYEGEAEEKAKQAAFDKADETRSKKVSLKKAPWDESVNESDDDDEDDDDEELNRYGGGGWGGRFVDDDEELDESADGRPYVCVHAKKGMTEVTATSSYGAAQKAAAKWGLKSTSGIDAHLADVTHTATESAKEPKNEQQQMREWANSVYKQYDDRGHYQEQPEGETVDLSLRRYVNAKAMPVSIEESHTPSKLAKAYRTFKGK